MKNEITIPSRFENIMNHYENYTPIFVKPKSDIKKFDKLAKKIKTQNSGALAILDGSTGVGKTALIHMLPFYNSEEFTSVLRVPDNLKFDKVMDYIQSNYVSNHDKIKIISLDGREIIDDEKGLKNLLTSMNQFLRRNSNVLICWPVNDEDWKDRLVDVGRKVGGNNFIPSQAVMTIEGPNCEKWPKALERLLNFLDKNMDELAIDEELVDEMIADADTLGEFLESIGDVVSDRIAEEQEDNNLPELVFVISSGKDLESEANRLRRAGNFLLKSEELKSYSPKSEPGKFWKSRGNKNPSENLAYIITLFNAKLLTVKSTAVNYSCQYSDNTELSTLAAKSGMKMIKANGASAVKSTDLYKFMSNQLPMELTSSSKGNITEDNLKLYSKIQKKSASMHKEINKAICEYFLNVIGDYNVFQVLNYEVNAGDQNLQVDVICEINNQEYYLEFHHLGENNCKAANMSRYIMDKLRAYSQHYDLVER